MIAAMIEAEGIGSRRQFRDGLETDPPYIQRATPPSGGRRTMPGGDTSPTPVGDRSEGGETGGGDIMRAIVTEASEINAVIIRASAREHEEFANVIKELDQPRDQVLLELILVSLQSTENFDLGVELAGARVGDVSTNVIGFSRFGIGAVDSGKGSISLPVLAPFGANCAIFNSGDFSLVINALKTVGDIRVTSAPKILVQDNSAAEIRQLNQEPFESSSQGAETTQTAFGGFVEAGTRLTVIPHVSKDAWLRLEYEVQLSSFGNRTAEQEAANLPPPRRESNSRGVVRVPAEHVVVLGGLTATRDDSTTDSVPFLGDVPIFGELFKDRSSSTIEETLFIFIRPVVLRDRGFQDLLFISEGDIERAQIKPDEPMNPLKLFGPEPETDQQP